ncbi:MAG: hypothetical protein QG639_1096 [Patescibacteria group bacterium]|nr:hypothetical protein [Patescibacteria group bacterium]
MIKNISSNWQSKIRTNKYLLFLILFIIAVRVPVLVDGLIPFQFDHGKDAIGSFHMWQTLSPKLIGPWTSIPGLFFGPAWYYMLLPGMVISGGNPVASVATMVLVGIVTVVIAYIYFGKTTATLVATSSLFYTITTSAWNPFPMVGVTMVLLAVLQHLEKAKKTTLTTVMLLGFFSALGFHFSTAFAVFYPVLIVLSVIVKKIRVTAQHVLAGAVAFTVPFIPQILFELTHDFIEVKSVLAYLSAGDSEPASLEKFSLVLSITWGELRPILLIPTYFQSEALNTTVVLISALLILLAILFFFKKTVKTKPFVLITDAALWFTIPLIGFTFLHFNLWYVLPLATFTFVLLGQLLDKSNVYLRNTFLVICFISALSKAVFYLQTDRESLLKGTTFLPNKEAAIEYIYQQAGGKPFASYHYMPDIYDYPYQYLYFVSAIQGNQLPTEFSYKPGEISYIPEKTELLEKFSSSQAKQAPQLIFYIVEKSDNTTLLDSWWSQQQFSNITEEKKISDVLTVYTALP